MNTDWYPDIVGRSGPRYVAIADAIDDALAVGRLGPGMRLPTQRDLARRLNVTIGTVSRAYQEAERRGLVSGEVGRGTYIREDAAEKVRAAVAGGGQAKSDTSADRSVDVPRRADRGDAATLSEVGTSRYGNSVVHLFRREPRPEETPVDGTPKGPDASDSSAAIREGDTTSTGNAAPTETAPSAPQAAPSSPIPSSPITSTASSSPKSPSRTGKPNHGGGRGQGTVPNTSIDLARPLNLATNRLPDATAPAMRSCLDAIVRDIDLAEAAAATVGPTDLAACAAANRLLARIGISAGSGETVLGPSGTSALDAVFAALARRGDALLVEGLIDPTRRTVALRNDLRPTGIQLDAEGVVPESFELAAWSSKARLFLTAPTAHNPTAATASDARRSEILEIVERYDITVIEWSASLPPLENAPRPLAAIAPHRTVHVADLPACALAGLRLASITAPGDSLDRIAREIQSLHRVLPGVLISLLEAVAAQGAYEAAIDTQRRLLAARRDALVGALGAAGSNLRAADGHGWLRLPEQWRVADFAVAAALRGVLVAGADHFLAGRGPVPRAVRLAWGCLATPEEAAAAGAVLADLIARPPEPGPTGD